MLSCAIQSIRYGPRVVLENLSFTLRKGGFLLVTGDNASGKTTLLSFVAGVLAGDTQVRIDGRCDFPAGWSDSNIAFLSQNPEANLVGSDVRSEIFLHGGQRLARIEQTLNVLRFPAVLLGRKVKDLSGGQQQLLAIVSALVRDSALCVLDEPTAMLDAQNTGLVVDAVSRLLDVGTTVIVSSHNASFWQDIPGRRLHLTRLGTHSLAPAPEPNLGLSPDPMKGNGSAHRLDVRRLWYAYRRQQPTIRNLSCCVSGGDILHVSGRNGCGKTTLAKLLAGVLRPSEGRIRLDGMRIQEIRGYRPHFCGLTLQNPNSQILFPTVSKELAYCASLPSPDKEFDPHVYASDTCLRLGISDQADPRSLSFAQRKLISSLSYLNMPVLHILDEPAASLSDPLSDHLLRFIKIRQKLGLITVVISHGSDLLRSIRTKEVSLDP